MSSKSSGNLPPRESGLQRSSGRSPGKKKKPSSGKRFLKLFIIILVIAGLALGLYFANLWLTADKVIKETGISKPVPQENSAQVKPLSMLLLGTDYRPETGTHLTDVMMVIAFNPKTKSATIVSLPRDTRFKAKGYGTNKINSLYPSILAETKDTVKAGDTMKQLIGDYFDLKIDYATVLNFQGFRDVVDALNGVNVNVDMDMCYRDTADGTDINLKKGAQLLPGKEALDYVRYRKSNCHPKTKGSDDFDRNRRQNEVLHALLDQAKSFNGIMGATGVIQAVGKNMDTDLESEQMKNMISTYWNISKENVQFMPVTGEWKSPYVYINDDELTKAKQALQDELSGKGATAANN
ncbi:LCP family protein required for cell wall assembly [Paenibacillus shirakamiensis]|uniref:LCP family protein required for cell wall assembly n=1 Tax=Paenibacillus shirakamiensis TaxID=1265935 RepID=A0ABS4JE19_9BACL|nr:LCP family protein [Paenibacillus shirakamiensis]MBP1999196.1 LCP family protein required for cell wall assembly [Paenibacillus shirakamiensis]